MKQQKLRFRVLTLITIALLVISGAYGVYSVSAYGSRWVSSARNTRYRSAKSSVIPGDILDRNGVVVATSDENGKRVYQSNTLSRSSMVPLIGDTEGNVVSLTEALGAENVTVNEFVPVVVDNYNAELGNVKVSFKFSTPYEAGKKVVVLVGIVDPLTGEVEWVALEGEGTGVDGAIAVEFTPEVLEAIQNGTAMMAVVSE